MNTLSQRFVLLISLVSACARHREPKAATPAPASASSDVLAIEVDRGRFVVHKADGSLATDDDLVGAELVAPIEGQLESIVRIDAVIHDPRAATRTLYSMSRKETDGSWVPLCDPGPDGLRAALPVPGRWSDSGTHIDDRDQFELTCTSGAIGKCVRFGYEPWQSAEMWKRHQACTRMIRADYCGTGRPHTKNGTQIDLYDTAGVQHDEPDPGMTFEAAWGAEGALCVRHPRIREIATLSSLSAECGPTLLVGDACTEEQSRADSRMLVMNKSL